MYILTQGRASAGSFIRDHFNDWIQDFVHNVGIFSVDKAKLSCILDGLGCPGGWDSVRVMLEVDNKTCVKLISKASL
ncbi:hypothetical protein M5689_012232 [Euphorbia peplus]|nr:hypothetical protein M5689_012232 [Euphorbia peplus]